MDYQDLKNVISIPKEEKDFFKKMIRDYRSKLIKSPSETVEYVFQENSECLKSIVEKKNISDTINQLRESSYTHFLIQESNFNVEILKNIGVQLNTPDDIINIIIQEKLNLNETHDKVISQVKEICVLNRYKKTLIKGLNIANLYFRDKPCSV